jgi:hypothetical protein
LILVEGGRSRRPLVIGLVILAVAAGIVLALVLSGGDDNDKTASRAPARTTESSTTSERTATERTGTTTAAKPKPPRRDAAGIEQTVTTFIESAEQSDSATACAQVKGGAGKQIEDCAAGVGINLRQLPSSDELEVDSVSVSGSTGTAKLSNGGVFSLEKSGGKWLISGFKPGPVAGG